MTIHSASARLDGADPADIIARVGAGLDQMDQPYRADPAQWLDYDTGIGLIRLRSSDGGLAIDLEADSAGNLHMLREGITWQLDQLGLPEQAALDWADAPDAERHPPNFRVATVLAKSRIGDSFIRLRLAAPDLEDFARSGLHYRLLLPPARRDPKWPVIGANGRTLWPEGEDALHTPAYTIRAIDAERGHFDTDILIHGRGPTCAWAETVEEGAIVGLSGPGGGWLPEGRKLTLLGDETALPAIARILESCAPDTVGEALIQVDGEGDIQSLAAPEGITVTWLLRGRDPELSDALEALTLPEGEGRFAWFAAEKSQADRARKYLRGKAGFDRKEVYIAAYWVNTDGADDLSGDR